MSEAAPGDWREVSLAEVCGIAIGGTPSRAEPRYWSNAAEGHHWVSIADLRSPIINQTKEFISDEGVQHSNVKLVPHGTVLMSFKLTIGRTAVAGCDLYTNEAIAAFTPNSDLHNAFLFHWLPHLVSTVETDQAVKGVTLNKQKLAAIRGLLPPLDEQRRIADVLRSVDEALSAEEGVLDQLARVKAAAVEHFIAEATLGESVLLSDITTTMDSGWSPDCESVPAIEDQWAILKTSAVTWAGYHDNQNKRLPLTLLPRPALSVEVGDILITRAGPADRTGVVAMVDETVGRRMLSDKIIRIRVDAQRAVPLTVATMLGSELVQGQIGRVKSGMAASQTNITQRIVAGLEIPLPAMQEQRRFASFMEALSQQSKLSKAQWSRLADAKTRLASDLLSGRVRVPA